MTPGQDHTDEESYLAALADEMGYSTWDEAVRVDRWRSGWRWLGIAVGVIVVFLPLGYLIGMMI